MHLWLMQVVILHPCTKFEARRPCRSVDMVHNMCQNLWVRYDLTLTLEVMCLWLMRIVVLHPCTEF